MHAINVILSRFSFTVSTLFIHKDARTLHGVKLNKYKAILAEFITNCAPLFITAVLQRFFQGQNLVMAHLYVQFTYSLFYGMIKKVNY